MWTDSRLALHRFLYTTSKRTSMWLWLPSFNLTIGLVSYRATLNVSEWILLIIISNVMCRTSEFLPLFDLSSSEIDVGRKFWRMWSNINCVHQWFVSFVWYVISNFLSDNRWRFENALEFWKTEWQANVVVNIIFYYYCRLPFTLPFPCWHCYKVFFYENSLRADDVSQDVSVILIHNIVVRYTIATLLATNCLLMNLYLNYESQILSFSC